MTAEMTILDKATRKACIIDGISICTFTLMGSSVLFYSPSLGYKNRVHSVPRKDSQAGEIEGLGQDVQCPIKIFVMKSSSSSATPNTVPAINSDKFYRPGTFVD